METNILKRINYQIDNEIPAWNIRESDQLFFKRCVVIKIFSSWQSKVAAQSAQRSIRLI